MIDFSPVLAVADAVLYEGYLLYPYTASAAKNRIRWQFGVVVPKAYEAAGTGERAEQQTEMLLEADPDAAVQLTVLLRFLQIEARRVDALQGDAYVPVAELHAGGTHVLTFDEGVARDLTLPFDARCGAEQCRPIAFPAGTADEPIRDDRGALRGRLMRERWALHGSLHVRCDAVDGQPQLRKIAVRVENASAVVAGERGGALRTAFVSAHVLLGVENGCFVSVLDPTPDAAAATATLCNRSLFPVLAGPRAHDEQHARTALASPIILYDFPQVAAQTQADAFDATEIDELLTLSVLSLSDAERAEARATDPRACAIVERAERFGAAELGKLHGGDLCVVVDGVKVGAGSAVVLHPKRRADVWDTFLDGKTATVRAIHQDLDDLLYVAVTVDDDPASDLHDWYGRSFFFAPDEIEPASGTP